MTRWLDVGLILGFMALVTVGGGYALMRLTTDTRPPVTIQSVEALNSPVVVGGSLSVRIRREKVRDDCPLTSIRWATDQDGRRHALPGRVDAQGGPAGSDWVDVAYPLRNLPPGSYTLSVRLLYRCPDGDHVIDQPGVPFRVW